MEYVKPKIEIYQEIRVKESMISTSQILNLEALSQVLKSASGYDEKMIVLDEQSVINDFLNTSPLGKHIKRLDIPGQFVIKALLAIGQGPVIFHNMHSVKNVEEHLNKLVDQLLEIEKFYDVYGGVVGYHLIVLKLLELKGAISQEEVVHFEMPPRVDISQKGDALNQTIRWGIDSLPMMGEMYPLGGAGDRLNLKNPVTGELLPAAKLLFCGRSLLELLIRDLQGREFLYYKLFGKQVVTPLAMMTSHEKNDHHRVLELCETNNWFGRPQSSFKLFIQPLVPMVTTEGEWAVSSPMNLILKPGGHGVIWKAALDNGIFDWFDQQHKSKVLIRQINNPIAGIDSGLLALCGLGCHQDKDFGFASCQRMVGSSEGMDVLREVERAGAYEYSITNIEYTEFKKHGIEDVAEKVGSPYSRFPTNTNILFGDLSAIRKALEVCPVPGMLINLKSRVTCNGINGVGEKFAGRLESTMQNIADFIVDTTPKKLTKEEKSNLRTFLTYNDRKKTISVTKQEYHPEKSLTDTPEGCFYDLQKNYHDLLVKDCGMILPSEQSEKQYLSDGPDCIVLFHPALGMLYSVICQKIKGGTLEKGSELILEISEVEIVNLNLDGSLIVEAESIMGKKDINGSLVFDSDECGKCTLINVKIKNKGRESNGMRNAWQCEHNRIESLRITLLGNAEFYAENVVLEGDVHFEVPDGHRLVVYQQGKEIAWHFEKISKASWKWEYYLEDDSSISLQKNISSRI